MRHLSVLFIAFGFVLASCSSSTVFKTVPPGATLVADGRNWGTTPCEYSDAKVSGSSTFLHLSLAGYRDLNITLLKSESANWLAIAGFPLLVPLLWVSGYSNEHSYVLTRDTPEALIDAPSDDLKARLDQLKAMLDAGTITREEYSTLREKAIKK